MFTRRIKEHISAHNWVAVGVDFLVVVIGILLAFQITEWADVRSDRGREKQLIADLLADLEIDRAQYADGLAVGKYRVSVANATMIGAGLPPIEFDRRESPTDTQDYSLEVADLSRSNAKRLDQLWTDVVIGFHPTLSTSAYDTMVGAGETRVIQDRDLVKAIQLYRNAVVAVEEQNDKLLSIRENVMYIGANWGLAPYLAVPAEEYFQLVAENPQLAAAIRIMTTFVIYHHGEIQTADAQAAELQVRLREYLAD